MLTGLPPGLVTRTGGTTLMKTRRVNRVRTAQWQKTRRDREGTDGEREFFNYPGPLFSARIAPASVVMKVNTERGFRCVLRDKSRRAIEQGVDIQWRIKEGAGALSAQGGEIVTFTAPQGAGSLHHGGRGHARGYRPSRGSNHNSE